MISLDPSTLLAGGAIAAVAAFWQQAKSLLNQVSGLFLINAKCGDMCYHVHWYLQAHYTTLPTGLVNYRVHWVHRNDRPRALPVVFRLTDSPWTIHYRKGSLILFGGTRILGIRGFSDIDGLVQKAIEFVEVQTEGNGKGASRFQVMDVVGMDRKRLLGDHRRNETVSSQPSAISGSDSPSSMDPRSDIHLHFTRALWQDPKTYQEQLVEADPFEHLYFEDNVWKHIEQAKQWIKMGNWYAERSIPWRRGWNLVGKPGTGKSSLAVATARALGIPIYVFHLSTLSDSEFLQEWKTMALPAMALMEDFDTVFNGRVSQIPDADLSFDTILNCLSGAQSATGLFAVITTNHLDKIDPALGVPQDGIDGISTRPGRMDNVLVLDALGPANQRKMATRILRDWPELIEKVLAEVQGGEVTPSQFQERCVQEALVRLKEQERAALNTTQPLEAKSNDHAHV